MSTYTSDDTCLTWVVPAWINPFCRFCTNECVYGLGSPCGFSSNCPNTDPSAPSTYVDAVESEGHTVDNCGGQADPMGFYHVHQIANLLTASQREACNLPPDTAGNHSELLGWLLEGFGLYGPFSQGGVMPTQLDECGGHTHKIDGVMTYVPLPLA